jgi:intein/homing endonuclease
MNTHTPFNDTIHSSNLCLTGDTIVDTNLGSKTLKELAEMEDVSNVLIRSYDEQKQEPTWAVLSRAFLTEMNNSDLYEIEYDGRIIRCTGDHQILTQQRGWQKARDLLESDKLIVE